MFPFIFFNESTSLYIYSALFQANAAILSIIGVFIIFRLQSLQSHIDTLKDYILSAYNEKFKLEDFFLFEQGSLKMKYQMIQNQDKRVYDDKGENNQYEDQGIIRKMANPFSMWFRKERELLQTKNMIKLPIRFLVLALLINALSLLFASNVHNYHPVFEVDLAYINILYEILVLLVVSSRMIFMVTKGAPLYSASTELNELKEFMKEEGKKEWTKNDELSNSNSPNAGNEIE